MTMSAVVKTRPDKGAEFLTVDTPKPAPDEVIVKVRATSICGTDVHIYKWDDWSASRIGEAKLPQILGHEVAGEVVEVGPHVRHVKLGDFVSAETHIYDPMDTTALVGQAHIGDGMEIQLLGERFAAERELKETGKTGAICHVVPPKVDAQALVRGPDQWNTMEIRCEGDDIRAHLNGTPVVEANMQQYEKLRTRSRSGFIGFYSFFEGPGNRTLAFRNIRIRELKRPNQSVRRDPDEAKRFAERVLR